MYKWLLRVSAHPCLWAVTFKRPRALTQETMVVYCMLLNDTCVHAQTRTCTYIHVLFQLLVDALIVK